MLTGHIDVVPSGPTEHWPSDPFKADRSGRVRPGARRGRHEGRRRLHADGDRDFEGSRRQAVRRRRLHHRRRRRDRRHGIARHGRPRLSRRRRHHDRADRQPDRAPLPRHPVGSHRHRRDRRSCRTVAQQLGHERSCGRDPALPPDARRFGHPQSALGQRSREESSVAGVAEPGHRHSDQGRRTSGVDRRPRRNRHRRPIPAVGKGRTRARRRSQARGGGAHRMPSARPIPICAGSLRASNGFSTPIAPKCPPDSPFVAAMQESVAAAGLSPKPSPASALTATSASRRSSDARRP